MIHIITFLWGSYDPAYVERLASAVKRNVTLPHRFICISDEMHDFQDVDAIARLRDPELTSIKGCFCRLRLFDTAYQAELGIMPGDRLFVLDLDLVITRNIDDLLKRQESFVILQGVNLANPCPFNGSVWSFISGRHTDVWHEFTLEKAAAVPFYEFPDDQGWLHAMIPNAAAYSPVRDGTYAFAKGGWPSGHGLPANAKLVAFPGKRDPSQFAFLPWVREHWLNR